MTNIIISLAFSLFLLMDPVGNIPIYLTVLSEIEHRKRQIIIFRESLISLFTIYLFAYFGDPFFCFLGISYQSIYIAGGIVLFVMALKMIFPEKGTLFDALATDGGEPLVFPLAIPLMAGPSVLAAVMIYSRQHRSTWALFIAIFVAWVISTMILLSSTFLHKWLGMRGIKALERLMGLVLMLIAINMFLEGWKQISIIPKPSP